MFGDKDTFSSFQLYDDGLVVRDVYVYFYQIFDTIRHLLP